MTRPNPRSGKGPPSCRLATDSDRARVLRLCAGRCANPLPTDLEDTLCAVMEDGSELIAAAILRLEPATRLGRLETLCAKGSGQARGKQLETLMAFLMDHVGKADSTEIVYSTTRTLTLEEQTATMAAGFKVLGVFPGAVSQDPGGINGLTAWYAPGVLEKKRIAGFLLHPDIAPFYELAAQQCGLPAVQAAERPSASYPDLPVELELIEAPRFAAEKFRRLKARRSLSINFYPFSKPNVLLTNADETVQVFASISHELGFATLIGEHLVSAVDPVRLYREAVRLLWSRGVRYTEAINDAADAAGIECILSAGFSPCGYFPALKLSVERRRDFVVFAHVQTPCTAPAKTYPWRFRFYEEYRKSRAMRKKT